MESLKDKVEKLLRSAYPDSTVILEQPSPAAKIGGLLIAPQFEGIEQIDRQEQLWSKLRGALSPTEQMKITAILTLTPDEQSVPTDE